VSDSANDSRVLLVDDDRALATVLQALIEQAGVACDSVPNADAALAALEREPYDVVITDLRMPGMDGMELLRRVNARFPDLPVIVITAHATVQLAVEAIRAGALDFLEKPFDREQVVFVVQKALTLAGRSERTPPAAVQPSDGLVFRSEPMREVDALISRAAASSSTILVRGETGTGKEVVARAIHSRSGRRDAPFVKLQCTALPDTLLEAELFGHERGAFTGAVGQRPGRLELAEGGTLFLDEIGDVSAPVQAKLLRTLQDREYERLGSSKPRRANVRFVTATHRDLEQLVSRGEFREDLFYRLNVITVWMPRSGSDAKTSRRSSRTFLRDTKARARK
jgi:two-component system, NtrC family, response regulator AtoC